MAFLLTNEKNSKTKISIKPQREYEKKSVIVYNDCFAACFGK
nr:hypothetical protein [Mucilaginibacter sp. FT3.2]